MKNRKDAIGDCRYKQNEGLKDRSFPGESSIFSTYLNFSNGAINSDYRKWHMTHSKKKKSKPTVFCTVQTYNLPSFCFCNSKKHGKERKISFKSMFSVIIHSLVCVFSICAVDTKPGTAPCCKKSRVPLSMLSFPIFTEFIVCRASANMYVPNAARRLASWLMCNFLALHL